MNNAPQLYLAAPFFSESEQQLNQRLISALEPKWTLYSPYRDGLRMADLVRSGVETTVAARDVWLCDLTAIRESVAVVAVLDGRVQDEGVCVEIGLANGLGKPVVGFRTDIRSCFPWGLNPMISGGVVHICSTIAELESWLARLET